MAHVGNGYAQQPAAGAVFNLHGIVKIAGVRAVNGHQGQVAHILAVVHVFGRGASGQLLGFCQHSSGKVARYFVVELNQLFLHGHIVLAPIVAHNAG